ncbi:hypothetical protein EON65_20265 [archaeon]|nr:MAG: hypothetical protein EON65_20265 [archaeon]
MEPFNLKNEREGGFFDENMNYVFKKEVGEMDAWVAGLSEAEMEAAIGEAALAEKKRLALRARKEAEADSRPHLTPLELKHELLAIMQRGETVSATMRRLSGKLGKGVAGVVFVQLMSEHFQFSIFYIFQFFFVDTKLGIKRRRPDEQKLSAAEQRKQQAVTAKQNRPILERVTEISDLLLSSGLSGVLEMTREALHASTISWEYKGADDIVYGPYSSQEIAGWKGQGYLTGPTAVLMRQARPPRPTPVITPSSGKIVDSIYDDDDLDGGSREPSNKKPKIEAQIPPADVGGEDRDWVSSDAIDFGVYLNLDQEALAYGKQEEEEREDVKSKVPFNGKGGGKGGAYDEDVHSDLE